MMRSQVCAWGLLAAGLWLTPTARGQDAPAAAVPAAPPAANVSAFEQRFHVLAERNMFLRDRRAAAAGRAGDAAKADSAPAAAGSQYVLVGVVAEGAAARAYFEQTGSGQIVKVGVGATVGDATVSQITLRQVTIRRGEQSLTVLLGQDLSGATAAALPAANGAAGGSTDPANMSVEERLRRRRQQELGQ